MTGSYRWEYGEWSEPPSPPPVIIVQTRYRASLCLLLAVACSDALTGVPAGLDASLAIVFAPRADTIVPSITSAGDSVVTSQVIYTTAACYTTTADAGLDDAAGLVVTVTKQQVATVCTADLAPSIARVTVHGVPAGRRTVLLMSRFVPLRGAPSSSELARAIISLP